MIMIGVVYCSFVDRQDDRPTEAVLAAPGGGALQRNPGQVLVQPGTTEV